MGCCRLNDRELMSWVQAEPCSKDCSCVVGFRGGFRMEPPELLCTVCPPIMLGDRGQRWVSILLLLFHFLAENKKTLQS